MILNAVMCVWNEEDIIESTIKHLFAQGCSNIFIVDNNSDDDTVKKAINVGAILIDSFESKYFDELEKIAHLNTVVKNYNIHSNEEYIWWLYVDADEFPNIDCNLTLYNFLESLDSSIRGIHGYMLNHIPTHEPYHMSTYHPIDFQPLCVKTSTTKIPLLRYDKNKPHLYSAGGAHTFDTCGEMITIAKDVLNIHHFNYRKPEKSINRLKQLCEKRSDGTRRVDRDDYMAKLVSNSENSQSMYISRYNTIQSVYKDNKYRSLMIEDLPYSYENIVRWYDICNYNDFLFQALNYFYNKKYDLSLCKFNDLLEVTHDEKLQLLIIINIAVCLSFNNKKEALSLLKPLLRCNDIEIHNYAVEKLQQISKNNIQLQSKNTIHYNIQGYFGEFKNKNFI